MKRLAQNDWCAAVFILLIGLGTVLGSLDYSMGTLARMGPGYFPLVLGVMLVFSGLLMLVIPTDSQYVYTNGWLARIRPWFFVLTGMLTFMVVGKYGGFVLATFLLVFISAFGDHSNTLKSSVILATSVTVVAVIAFHYGLQLQFPLFVWG